MAALISVSEALIFHLFTETFPEFGDEGVLLYLTRTGNSINPNSG